jgi:DnaJ-like protein
MSSTVKSRPNHYEVLGLAPGASSHEIAQAFAKELSDRRPRAFGSLAEVTVAYETLRDRMKREAYDISLGLKPKAPTPPPPAPPEWKPFAMHASPRPAPRPAEDLLSRLAPKADAPPSPEPPAEPKLPPPAAASPPDAIDPKPRDPYTKPTPPAEELQRPEVARPRPELPSGEGHLHFAEAGRFKMDGEATFQWKLPALGAGLLIVAVAIGASTGLEAGNEQTQTENSVTLKVPAARPLPELAGSPLELPRSVAEARPQQSTRPTAAEARAEHARPPLQIDLPETQSRESAQSGAGPSDQTAIEAAADSVPTGATSAGIPLPNAVIARTIGRIGYPCGEVASTTAMEGTAGVFKVTCTSGHSYRAAPVRGRYRFRRLG